MDNKYLRQLLVEVLLQKQTNNQTQNIKTSITFARNIIYYEENFRHLCIYVINNKRSVYIKIKTQIGDE